LVQDPPDEAAARRARFLILKDGGFVLCQVPWCGEYKRGRGLWICKEHWRMVDQFSRRRFDQALQLMNRDPADEKLAFQCQRWFERCREEAIEQHFCIKH
jgi:predicted RNA-binding protein YlxR (DUF448 family)